MTKYKYHKGRVSKLGPNMAYTGSLAGTGMGTCPIDCRGCYAKTGNFEFPNVKESLTRMAIGLKTELLKVFSDFETQWNNAKTKPKYFRINHSGDIVSTQHWYNWIDFAVRHPECTFYIYTKRTDIVAAFFADGWELPDNFVLNVSIWGDYGRASWESFKYHKNVNCFIVDLDPVNVENVPGHINCRCAAYENVNGKIRKSKNAKTCEECKLCLTKRKAGNGLAIHCFKHH